VKWNTIKYLITVFSSGRYKIDYIAFRHMRIKFKKKEATTEELESSH
jgi:hypothetical protein